MNDAFCGGPDSKSLNASAPLVSKDAFKSVAALILMGDPRHTPGSPFNVGNATVGGVSFLLGGARTLDQRPNVLTVVELEFAKRPRGFRCPDFEDRIQLYCDSPDPYCSNGTDPAVHQGYGKEYGIAALSFILTKLLV